MLRFSAILFFIIGYSYHANAQLGVNIHGSDGRNECPFADGNIVVSVYDEASRTGDVTLDIKCAPNSTDPKKTRRELTVTLASDEKKENSLEKSASTATSENIKLANNNMATGDHCTVEARFSNETASADFTVGYNKIGSPQTEIVGGVSSTVGKEFRIGKLPVNNESVFFFDLVLRECTASTDPWIFWYDNDNDSLQRVYPTSTNSESHIPVTDKDTANDNHCLGSYDGQLKNLVTIGDDHAGCKLKLVKDNVTHGDAFTAQGAPTLAADVAVTTANGKVMVHTGTKPTNPSNISDNIAVYVSTNRGFTWTKSTITGWTSSAQDSGSTATMDNTRHLAMIRLTDGTNFWWRIIRGQ